MADLAVLLYDDDLRAEEARVALRRLEREGVVSIEETAVVARRPDGTATLTQDVDLVATRRTQGRWLGTLVALVTGVQPLMLLGMATGDLVGRLMDRGIDNRFMKDVQRSLEPGTSALFLLGKSSDRDALFERRPFGGRLLHTSLPDETAAKIRAALEAADGAGPDS